MQLSLTQLVLPERTWVQWQNLRHNDPVLTRVAMYVQRGHPANRLERRNESKITLQVLSHWDRLILTNGVLHLRLHDPKEPDTIFQILLSEGERYNV